MAVLDHVGWAVSSIDASRAHFEVALGLAYCGEESHPGLRVAFFGDGPSYVELLEPLDAGSGLSAFVHSHGDSVHHLALRVDDVGAALAEAEQRGLRLVDRQPRPGSRGTIIGFVDPGRPDGILIQYVQSQGEVR
jgi:methylmalonyl-CoA/ethylmalonyl-CoA epimerase